VQSFLFLDPRPAYFGQDRKNILLFWDTAQRPILDRRLSILSRKKENSALSAKRGVWICL
jgi:hypothetical protein